MYYITISSGGHFLPQSKSAIMSLCIREPGPHLPTTMEDSTGLDMFQLFFDDSVVERLVRCINEYAELKKDEKKYMYRRFKLETLTVQEMRRFLGILILLGINKV